MSGVFLGTHFNTVSIDGRLGWREWQRPNSKLLVIAATAIITKQRQATMPRLTRSIGENMPTISSLTDEINRLSASISRWNTAIVVLMVLAALAATGLVIAQRIAFKKAEHLADLAEQRAKLDSAAKDSKIRESNDRRVKLENRIVDLFGPRQLTAEQLARITGKLAGLKGVKIDVYVLAVGNPYTPDDSEDSVSIGHAVVRTLRAAPASMDAEGWLLEDCHGSGASNVVVSVNLPGSDTDRKIAKQVLNALRSEIGTDPEIEDQSPSCTKFSSLDKARPNKRKNDAAINITIGRKINPLLTREMLEPKDEQNNPSLPDSN